MCVFPYITYDPQQQPFYVSLIQVNPGEPVLSQRRLTETTTGFL